MTSKIGNCRGKKETKEVPSPQISQIASGSGSKALSIQRPFKPSHSLGITQESNLGQSRTKMDYHLWPTKKTIISGLQKRQSSLAYKMAFYLWPTKWPIVWGLHSVALDTQNKTQNKQTNNPPPTKPNKTTLSKFMIFEVRELNQVKFGEIIYSASVKKK